MHLFLVILGALCCTVVIFDALQTVILPRRPKSRFRLTALYYICTWRPFAWSTQRLQDRRLREQLLSAFGPLSLLLLFALWASLLICGFSLIFYGLGTPYLDTSLPSTHPLAASLRTDLYVSGTTLTTLGPGDVVPRRQAARLLMVIESGAGLGFVALVISYVPVLYSAFSRREVSVALLDGRAGSPPTAAELITRHTFSGGTEALTLLLVEWERWAAELLETHISYPVLCFYRSQHDNQSWLAALTTILDTCALLITTVEGDCSRQAQLTFAIGRHAIVDLIHVFHLDDGVRSLREQIGSGATPGRLPQPAFHELCGAMSLAGVRLCSSASTSARLVAIRNLYEAEANVLAEHLCLTLPAWITPQRATDPWHTINRLSNEPEEILAGTQHLSTNSAALNLYDQSTHGT